jgi:hypothetical protein
MNQPKQLKVFRLKPKDEFHPGGILFQIIDNDGKTILKEWWDVHEKIGIQFCRNWLKVRAGEELEFSTPPEPTPNIETPKEPDAKPDQVG